MPTNVDTVKLQLAMAFGQGAGAMLADLEALDTLLAERGDILTRAMQNWEESQWAFTTLVRTLGQVAAARAAVEGSAVIRWPHVEASLAGVMSACPCIERFDPQQPATVRR
jgi:hypothetical protein